MAQRERICGQRRALDWLSVREGTTQKNGRTRFPAVKDSTEHDIKSARLAGGKRIAESAALKNETARPNRKTRPLQIRTLLCTPEQKEKSF